MLEHICAFFLKAICVCVCVCVYMYIYIYIYMCVCVCKCSNVFACTNAFILYLLPLCSVLVYHGSTNANIGPCQVGS